MSQRASRLNVAAIASGCSTGGRWRRVGAAAVAALGLGGAAMADNISWVGPAGTPAPFEVGSNWAGGNVPDADDLSFIDNGGVASLTTYTGEVLTVSLGSGTSTSGTLVQGGGSLSSLAGIFIAGHATASGTYTMNAGTLRGNDFYIGSKGVGTFNLNGGTVISAAAFRLADDEGSTGVMNMTGGTVSVPAHFLVGHFSPAGSGSITTGTFNLSGGTLTAAHYNLGQHPNARGEVHQTGGFVNNTANTVIGEHSRLANLYDLSGGTLRVAGGPAGGSVFVASSRGVGELRISGTGNAQIDGHIQVAGGTADTSLPVAMGTFNLSGGTVVLGLNKPEGGFLIAGEFGTATVAISGGNFTSDFLQLGRRAFVSSQGQATQTGGNVTVRRSMTIGGLSANDNFYRISGGTLNMTNDLGAGTLNETQSGIHVARFSVNPGTFAPATEYSRARFTVDGTAVVNIAGGLYNSTGFTGVITKAGGGTQSVQLPGGAGTVEVLGGTLTAGSFLNGGAANAGSFNNGGATANYVQSGGVATLGPVTGTGNVAVSGGTMNVNSLSQAAATVSGNGTVRVAPNGTSAGTSRVNTLAISGSGRFDLTNNALVVDYTGASPLADVRADIVSAYAGGAWTGPGLTSTQATANTHGVGYGEASSLTSIPEIFGTVDATAVLARHTRYGDANLDGTVNLADFNRLAANFGATNAVWTQGDFNYDSIVNLSDFNRLAANFGQNAAGAAVTPEDWANLASAIPEPGALGLAGLGAVAALVRRRRRAV